MILSIKEGDMTISKEFIATEDHDVSAEEVLIGAYDVLSRVFTQKAVVRAYYKTDPDTMDLRDPDDKVLQIYQRHGLLAGTCD